MSEEELLRMLDSQEPALQVCFAVYASPSIPAQPWTVDLHRAGVRQAFLQCPAQASLPHTPKPCTDHATEV